MNFINLTLNEHFKEYDYSYATNIEMDILANFLTTEVGSYINFYKKWALNDQQHVTGGNITWLEKEGNIILLTDMYSEEEKPTALRITIAQFVQLLDDWQEKVCKRKPKEVIIKYEKDQFTIETKE